MGSKCQHGRRHIERIFASIRKNVVHQKNGFSWSELLRDYYNLCHEEDSECLLAGTRSLKRSLQKEIPNGSYPSSRQEIVHAADMNPCEFSTATLRGHGLRDNDLIKAFASLLRRKNWPYTSDELIKHLDKGPVTEMYNVFYASIDPGFKINEYGYPITKSQQPALKIWSMAANWETLLTKNRSAKQTVACLTIHRLTSSEETLLMLHKMNNRISYDDIRIQNRLLVICTLLTACYPLAEEAPLLGKSDRETSICIYRHKDKCLVYATVRSYHAYLLTASVQIGEIFACEIELDNPHDKYAVAVRKQNGVLVSRVPNELLKLFNKFLRECGDIEAEGIGHRINAGKGNGVEIPVDFRFVAADEFNLGRLKKNYQRWTLLMI
eukprot:gene11520-12711_t